MHIIDFLIKLLPLIGLFTFIKVVYEYHQGQKWKKSEFLAKEIKEFQNDSDVKLIFQLLDWNSRKINLRGNILVIDDEKLINALIPHSRRNRFEPYEADLRDIFDKFFDKISTFRIYVKNGLVSEKELHLFIGYYINILTDNQRKPQPLINAFNEYLTFYGFDNVIEIIESFKKYS